MFLPKPFNGVIFILFYLFLLFFYYYFLPETLSPGSLKIQAHASREDSSGLTQRSASAALKLSPRLPETLPSSSERLVSWPEFRVANPSLAGFQVSLQALALLATGAASGHSSQLAGAGGQQEDGSPRQNQEGTSTKPQQQSEGSEPWTATKLTEPIAALKSELRRGKARPVRGLWCSQGFWLGTSSHKPGGHRHGTATP